MPISYGNFKPQNFLFKNAHCSTIYASLLRYIPRVKYERERMELPDGDFIDLDWSRRKSNKLVLILAGLEGKSSSIYTRATIRYFNKMGWDAVCMNYRGCSGQANRLLKGYHMGASDDVKYSIAYILQNYTYESISLIGFSLGGNLALKYLGENSQSIPKEVKASVSFSVPIHISKSNDRLMKWYNWHYLKWFMIPLNRKANRKKRAYPKQLKTFRGFFMTGNFKYFDEHFTVPANGFSNLENYYQLSSCSTFLKNIHVPSLVVDSEDDTFISQDCYPRTAAAENPNLHLEINQYGGHCGFIRKLFEKDWWMEQRAFAFIKEHA